jgi:hypothetical protein
MQDTFYVDGRDSDDKLLLRTHTSPMQVRYARMHVEKYAGRAMPPIKVIARAARTAWTAMPPTRRCSIRSKACGSART